MPESSLQFNGQNNYVAINNWVYDFQISDFAVEVWIKTDQANGTIVSWDPTHYWELAIKDGHVRWATTLTYNTSLHDMISNARVDDGEWHLISVTFRGGYNQKEIYIDAQLDKTEQLDLPLGHQTIGSGVMRYGFLGVRSSADIFDGAKVNNTYFSGKMTEVRIWQQAPTQAQFASNMLKRISGQAPHVLKYYPLKEDVAPEYDITSVTTRDTSAHLRHTSTPAGPLVLDGSTSYLAIEKPVYQANEEIRQITVEARIRTSKTSGEQIIASWDRNTFWRLSIWNGRVLWATTHNRVDDFRGRIFVADGQWHAISVTYDINSRTKQIYIDGRPDGTRRYVSLGHPIKGSQTRYGFFGIGSEATTFDGNKGPYNYFAGELSWVRLWDIARRQIDIKRSLNKLTDKSGLLYEWNFSEIYEPVFREKIVSGIGAILGTLTRHTWTPDNPFENHITPIDNRCRSQRIIIKDRGNFEPEDRSCDERYKAISALEYRAVDLVNNSNPFELTTLTNPTEQMIAKHRAAVLLELFRVIEKDPNALNSQEIIMLDWLQNRVRESRAYTAKITRDEYRRQNTRDEQPALHWYLNEWQHTHSYGFKLGILAFYKPLFQGKATINVAAILEAIYELSSSPAINLHTLDNLLAIANDLDQTFAFGNQELYDGADKFQAAISKSEFKFVDMQVTLRNVQDAQKNGTAIIHRLALLDDLDLENITPTQISNAFEDRSQNFDIYDMVSTDAGIQELAIVILSALTARSYRYDESFPRQWHYIRQVPDSSEPDGERDVKHFAKITSLDASIKPIGSDKDEITLSSRQLGAYTTKISIQLSLKNDSLKKEVRLYDRDTYAFQTVIAGDQDETYNTQIDPDELFNKDMVLVGTTPQGKEETLYHIPSANYDMRAKHVYTIDWVKDGWSDTPQKTDLGHEIYLEESAAWAYYLPAGDTIRVSVADDTTLSDDVFKIRLKLGPEQLRKGLYARHRVTKKTTLLVEATGDIEATAEIPIEFLNNQDIYFMKTFDIYNYEKVYHIVDASTEFHSGKQYTFSWMTDPEHGKTIHNRAENNVDVRVPLSLLIDGKRLWYAEQIKVTVIPRSSLGNKIRITLKTSQHLWRKYIKLFDRYGNAANDLLLAESEHGQTYSMDITRAALAKRDFVLLAFQSHVVPQKPIYHVADAYNAMLPGHEYEFNWIADRDVAWNEHHPTTRAKWILLSDIKHDMYYGETVATSKTAKVTYLKSLLDSDLEQPKEFSIVVQTLHDYMWRKGFATVRRDYGNILGTTVYLFSEAIESPPVVAEKGQTSAPKDYTLSDFRNENNKFSDMFMIRSDFGAGYYNWTYQIIDAAKAFQPGYDYKFKWIED